MFGSPPIYDDRGQPVPLPRYNKPDYDTDPPVGFRHLVESDVIQKGDLVFTASGWMPVGNTIYWGETFRSACLWSGRNDWMARRVPLVGPILTPEIIFRLQETADGVE